jgi:spore coat polysaccharide biosynthesis protein SpsF (cytidylyltransferase family)
METMLLFIKFFIHICSMNNGKIIAMIPARYAATRFPGKLMQVLGDKTVIRHTYEATVATGCLLYTSDAAEEEL